MRSGDVGRALAVVGLGLMVLALIALDVRSNIEAVERIPEPGGVQGEPLAGYTTHVVATHWLRDRSYEAHHYFKPLQEGVLQGLVFRETADGAALIEVEWAIAREVWEKLPEWQRELWHPLFPAVEGGRVRVPALPPQQERELLGTIRGLYAQTFNLAGLEGELPTGLEGVGMATHLSPTERRRMMGAMVPAGD